MQHRFGVDDYRMPAGENDVLVVDIDAFEQEDDRKQSTRAGAERVPFGGIGRGAILDPLTPAVAGALQGSRRAQVQQLAGRIQRIKEVGKGEIHRQRARLVDEPEAAGERDHGHRAQTVVRVRQVEGYRNGLAQRRAAGKVVGEQIVISLAALGELHHRRRPALGHGRQQPGQDGIGDHEPGDIGQRPARPLLRHGCRRDVPDPAREHQLQRLPHRRGTQHRRRGLGAQLVLARDDEWP